MSGVPDHDHDLIPEDIQHSWWWDETAKSPAFGDEGQLWARMQSRMQEDMPERARVEASLPASSGRRHATPRHAAPRAQRQWLWGGVSLGALALAAAGWFYQGYRTTDQAPLRYVTQAGERVTVTLADSTKVVLAPGTAMEVRGRHVTLDGQALFTVVHHGETPFTVEAHGITTRVLGTEFGVRAYDTRVNVAVRNGRVAAAGVVLDASDMIMAARDGDETKLQVVRNGDVNTALAFAEGRLVIADTRLRDAIPALNRWYDADVQLGTATLGDKVLNATFRVGSRTDLAELLELMFGGRVERSGRTVTLYGERK